MRDLCAVTHLPQHDMKSVLDRNLIMNYVVHNFVVTVTLYPESSYYKVYI